MVIIPQCKDKQNCTQHKSLAKLSLLLKLLCQIILTFASGIWYYKKALLNIYESKFRNSVRIRKLFFISRRFEEFG